MSGYFYSPHTGEMIQIYQLPRQGYHCERCGNKVKLRGSYRKEQPQVLCRRCLFFLKVTSKGSASNQRSKITAPHVHGNQKIKDLICVLDAYMKCRNITAACTHLDVSQATFYRYLKKMKIPKEN